ncbi:MAG: hypothetical protein ACLSGP_09560 [Faecalibacterium prausnitzii]
MKLGIQLGLRRPAAQILKSLWQATQIEVEVYQGTYDDVKEWLRTGQGDSPSCPPPAAKSST